MWIIGGGGGGEGKKERKETFSGWTCVRAIDSLGLLLYIICIREEGTSPRCKRKRIIITAQTTIAFPIPFQFVGCVASWPSSCQRSWSCRNVKNLKSNSKTKVTKLPEFISLILDRKFIELFENLSSSKYFRRSSRRKNLVFENRFNSWNRWKFVANRGNFILVKMLPPIGLDRFGEEELWKGRKSGGPQGRIFLSRQYLSSLCPVVKPASFSPARDGAVAPRATLDYKSRPIPSPLVANEPCVFMRFAIRLPDPGGPILIPR